MGLSKIVVIHPPQEVEQDFIDYPYFTGLPALTLATVLRQKGHFVHLLDALCRPGAGYYPLRAGRGMFGVPYAALLEPLEKAEFDCAIVHFTPFALGRGYSEGLAGLIAKLRVLRPEARILGAELYAGGMHRIRPNGDELKRFYPELDLFVALEGEATIPDLIDSGLGASFLVQGQQTHSGTLDQACPPDWDYPSRLGFQAFMRGIRGLPKLRQYRIDEHTAPVYFSRGCPFSCAICTNPSRDYRPISMPRVHELISWAQKEEVTRLFALDDAANVRPDFAQVLEAVRDAGLRVEFPNGLRADLLSQEVVELLAQVADQVTVSGESASPRVQTDIIGKSVKVAHVERTAQWCKEAGVALHVHWLVGLPGETRDEALLTLETARNLLDAYQARPLVQYATAIPGTGLPGDILPPKPGNTMQHRPTFLPESVAARELTDAVSLLRQRGRDADTQKVIINLTYRCNNHCLFCAVGNRIQEDLPFEYICEVLEKYREQGVELVDFDGGEPTVHEHLVDIVKHAAKQGYRTISMTTNARRLAYPDFSRRVLNAGLTNVLVSLHGPNSKVHEGITGVPGSFRETMDGLRNLLAYRSERVSVGVNTTLSVQNYELLERLVEILHPMGVDRLNIQFLTPFGRAAADAVPDPEKAAGVVRSVIERWREKIRFQVINLPYCYLPGLEEYVAQDLGKLSRNMVFVTRQEVNLYKYLAETRAYDESCEGCFYRVACDGKYDFSEVLD